MAEKKNPKVQRSFRVPQDQLDRANRIAARHADGNLSLVARRALAIGLQALAKDPKKLLGPSP